ncbi:hypothetical protein V6N13_037924 [Hibiscus sabdariffa]|uniref:C2 domain-containing protein n=1 Tax=Hibiscus sabdariffa TaxID=183260 RepID=A0ABR2S3M2_9ROSI
MASEEVDYSLRETRPNRVFGIENLTSSFVLVDQMEFLFVRIVRARDLPLEALYGIMNSYVELKIESYCATTTEYFEKKPDSEWNRVLALARERFQATTMEINVINMDMIGKITTALYDIPTCLPPDSAPCFTMLGKVN